jgi:hypothetical protein
VRRAARLTSSGVVPILSPTVPERTNDACALSVFIIQFSVFIGVQAVLFFQPSLFQISFGG